MTCQWTKGPDGKWAVSGPLEELRKGSVLVNKKNGAQVQEYVGTPIQQGRWWIAYPVKHPYTADGGSWVWGNWRWEKNRIPSGAAANTRPPPRLKPIQGTGSDHPVFKTPPPLQLAE